MKDFKMNNEQLPQVFHKLSKVRAALERVQDNINIAQNTKMASDVTKLAQSKMEFKQAVADLFEASKTF
jgi:uncharacterized membrane protein (DUF106 family)